MRRRKSIKGILIGFARDPLFLLFMAAVVLWCRMLGCCAPSEKPPTAEAVPDPYEFELEYEEKDDGPGPGKDSSIEKTGAEVKARIIGYEFKLVKAFSRELYATCYSKEDGPVEAKGIYANQKYAELLNRSERRIQRHHWTVALPPELKEYHRALIYVDGLWTHKYRVHVPGYNTADKTRGFDAGYWSVPRDRMLQKGRIDVLFTTAGAFATIKQRQREWAGRYTHKTICEFWELKKVPIYAKEK